MRSPLHIPAPKRDRLLALVALSLLLLFGAYHVADVRGAFRDFDTWWTFFKPMYPGDDYVAVTATAEHSRDWHDRYRAITVGVAVHRALDRVDYLIRPADFWHLWGSNPNAPRTWDDPGIKEDYFRYMTSQTEHIELDYNPVLPDETIETWRDNGWVTDLAWNVAYVNDGTDDDTVVMHADRQGLYVYVVPAHLSPVAEQFGDVIP